MRASTARQVRWRRTTKAALWLALWLSIVTAGYFALQAVTQRFFLQNPEYTIRTVEADLDGLLTTQEAMQIMGIHHGDSIFKVDLVKAERALRQIDQISRVRIQRIWPDKLTVRIEQRRPVAWLVSESADTLSTDTAWLVTEDAFCMRPYKISPSFWSLPIIYTARPEKILAKDSLAMADLRAAIDLLREQRKRPSSRLAIRSLNISKGYAIDVADQDGFKAVLAASDFREQLERLEKLLEYSSQTGRKMESANLIPKKYTPVRFVMAAVATPAPQPTPKVSSTKPSRHP